MSAGLETKPPQAETSAGTTRYGGFGPQARRADAARRTTPHGPAVMQPGAQHGQLAHGSRGNGYALLVSVISVIVPLVMAAGLSMPLRVIRMRAQLARELAYWSQMHHDGPVAPLASLKGEGRVYLLPLGNAAQPYGTTQIAEWLRAKYELDVRVLPAMPIDRAAWDWQREEYVAELVGHQIDHAHPELAAEPNAVVIGITDENMYLARESGELSYSARLNGHLAVVSTYGFAEHGLLERWAYGGARARELPAKLRRMVLKDLAVLHWHLPMNNDPSSLLHDPLNPRLPTEDLYASDLDPMGTKWGEAMNSPCLFFVWSAKAGIHAMNGPSLRPCERKMAASQDESTETVQVDLLTQMVRDARTDLYLADSVPIAFQRVLRPGGTNPTEFGVSGSHSYDKYLWAAKMSMLHLTGPEFTNEDLKREPWWLPYEPVNRWVDADFSGRLLTLTHHSLPHEHYELRGLNGSVEDYLPCEGSIPCYLNGYRDAQGRTLQFDRSGPNRRLDRLTSPNGSWLKLEYDNKERLTSIYDSNGHYVKYGYNNQNQLTRVRHADGSVMSYSYDGQQRLLTISASADEESAPQELLRSTYDASGRLVEQALAGGEVYRYAHHPAAGAWRRWVTVETPDGRATEVYMDGRRAGLWRKDWAAGQVAK